MKCQNCNQEIPADSKFCPACGTAITGSVTEPASNAQMASEQNQNPTPTEPQANQYQQNTNSQYQTDPNYQPHQGYYGKPVKKKRTGLIITLIIVGVLLIGGTVFGFLFLPNMLKYNQANNELTGGNYTEAIELLQELDPSYRDTSSLLIQAKYLYGIELLEKEYYNQAYGYLKDIDYQDSKIAAQYCYVVLNPDRYNEQTMAYLQTLIAEDYKNSKAIYADLTKWEISVVVNTSADDLTTDLSSVSKYDTWYCHILVKGGEIGESISLYYNSTFPDGTANDGPVYEYYDNYEYYSYYWYNNPEGSNATGNFIYKVINKSNGEVLVTRTIKIVD